MNLWPTMPEPPPLFEGGVHVWSIALDAARFDTESSLNRLSREEQARAQRFKFADDRRRYIVAHVALRDILAGYLELAAGDLRFVDGENGKPRLASTLAGGGIEFNLSHSHEQALIAATQQTVVGIDLEFVKNDFEFHEVAERFFTDREMSALRALPGSLQRQAFYKCWTSKEAFLKARGTGLSDALDEVEISLTAGSRVVVNAFVAGWTLIELHPGEGYEGAVVVEGEKALPLHCHRWQPTQ
jgi:4'-phosphopantetheinyl transferase